MIILIFNVRGTVSLITPLSPILKLVIMFNLVIIIQNILHMYLIHQISTTISEDMPIINSYRGS